KNFSKKSVRAVLARPKTLLLRRSRLAMKPKNPQEVLLSAVSSKSFLCPTFFKCSRPHEKRADLSSQKRRSYRLPSSSPLKILAWPPCCLKMESSFKQVLRV